MSRDDVFTRYPRGWFGIGFADEFPAGQPQAIKYFGRDLVAYRGESGQVHVMEAHCPHMGAHLAVGGKVKGDCITCPFHAWKFGPDGQCVDIPYAKKIPPRAKVESWPVREVNGVVLMHHDPDGQPPGFDIPVFPEIGSDEWLPWSTHRYRIKTHPREIVDNLADKAHFPAVHATEIDEFVFTVDGHTATARTKGRAFFGPATETALGSKVDPFASTTTYHGPAYLIMRMDGLLSNYMLLLHTPIDENTLDLRMGVTLKIVGDLERTQGYVAGYMKNLQAGFEDDIRIWEHKVYRQPPLLCEGDGPIGPLRKWYRQFYVPREAS
jgi:3-ketosteroid 9alpha-monooxygenase subunit A